MEIREIREKHTWEKFIKDNSPHSFFQSWSWGEVIRKNQKSNIKHQILWRLGIYKTDELVGIAQIEKVEAKRGTFLHIRHGPIFKLWNKKKLSALFEYLRKSRICQNVNFIRISPLIENSDKNNMLFKNIGFIDAPIHRIDGEYIWVLDIDKDDQTMFSQMRKTTRYLIRQAQKMGVEIIKSKDNKDLVDFLRLYEKTAVRQHFIPHKGIVDEFNELISHDQILLFMGYYQKNLISAALIVFYNHQAIYHHSASIEQKIPVNYLLQWEAIKEAKRRNKTIYNFWGIAPIGNKRHPWRGLTLFKTGFGGNLIEYIHAKDLPLSTFYCATYLIEWIRRIWKGY